MSKYPECDRLRAVQDQSQIIGEFIEEWLPQQGIHLAEYIQPEGYLGEHLAVTHRRTEALLAEFFGIDLDKVEVEKRAMLDEIRALNEVAS